MIGWAWLVAAPLAALGPEGFLRFTHGLAYLPTGRGWGYDAAQLAGVAAWVVWPAATAIGVAFPALLEWAGRTRSSSVTVVGRVLAANLAGCVLGALAAGFVLPRVLGMWHGMSLAAAVLMAGGAWCLMRVRAPGRRVSAAVTAAIVVGTWFGDLPRVRSNTLN